MFSATSRPLVDPPWPDGATSLDVKGRFMKHTAWRFCILGLLPFFAAFAEDSTRTETKEEREVTPTTSKHKVESKRESRRGSHTTTDEKTIENESRKRSDGKTDTERTTTTKHKVESKTKKKGESDPTIREKAVEVETRKRADGKTETQKTTTVRRSAPNMKDQTSTTKERTVESSEGKILEHEKTSR
jgi:hypothetical protein